MGKAGQIIVGALMIAGGVVLTVASGGALWTYGAALASNGGLLIYNAVVPVQGLSDRQASMLDNRTDTRLGLPVVYGTTRLGGIMVEARIDPSSSKQKRLVMVIALCHGKDDGTGIDGIASIYLDDKLAWGQFSGTQAPFDKAVSGDAYQDKHLEITPYLGTAAQVVDPDLAAIFPDAWPAEAAGKGVAYIVAKLWFNEEVFATGIPRINAYLRGQKLYDPRDATTVFSTNPALAIWDYLTSTTYGFGIPADKLDSASFESAADYCDELVVPFGSEPSQKRFETNGALDTNRPLRANLADLCTACRGQMINVAGVWKLLIRREQTSSGIQVTTKNTIEGSWRYILPGSSDAANRIVASYIDPARDNRADSVQWPEPDSTNPYLEQDGGYEHAIQIDLPLTDNRLRAQQIAITMLRESREGITTTFTGKEELLVAGVGDIIEITQPSPGWVAKPFWVLAKNYRPMQGEVDFACIEYEPSVYDLDEQFPQPEIPDTGLPDATNMDPPTSLILTATDAESVVTADGVTIARILAEWTPPEEPFLHHYEIQAKRASDGTWDSYGTATKDDEQFFITPVTSELWDVRVRAVSSLGVPSPWLSDSVTPLVSSSVLTTASYEIADAPLARLRLRETDLSLPNGLWGLTLEDNILKFQQNTAVAGDFSSLVDHAWIEPTGELGLHILNDLYVGTSGKAIHMGADTSLGGILDDDVGLHLRPATGASAAMIVGDVLMAQFGGVSQILGGRINGTEGAESKVLSGQEMFALNVFAWTDVGLFGPMAGLVFDALEDYPSGAALGNQARLKVTQTGGNAVRDAVVVRADGVTITGFGAFTNASAVGTVRQDALFLQDRGSSAGSGNYAQGLAASRLGDTTPRRMVALVPRQQTADPDQVGWSLFTHPTATDTDAMQEHVRFGLAGDLATQFYGALAITGALTGATTGDFSGVITAQTGMTITAGQALTWSTDNAAGSFIGTSASAGRPKAGYFGDLVQVGATLALTGVPVAPAFSARPPSGTSAGFFIGDLNLIRFGGASQLIAFRVNGAEGAETGVLSGESIFNLSIGAWTSAGSPAVGTGLLFASARENFTGTAQGFEWGLRGTRLGTVTRADIAYFTTEGSRLRGFGAFTTATAVAAIRQDILLLHDSASTAGSGNFGQGIAFSRLSDASPRRMAAITTRQTTADADQIGLSFFVHDSATDTVAMSQILDLSVSGDLASKFYGALAITGALTGATTGAFSGLLSANAGLTVASGQTLTLTGATVTGLTAASVGAGTFPSGAFVFAGAVSGITTLSLAGPITLTTAASKIISGATSFAVRNSADTISFLSIISNGGTTITSTAGAGSAQFTVTGSTTATADSNLFSPTFTAAGAASYPSAVASKPVRAFSANAQGFVGVYSGPNADNTGAFTGTEVEGFAAVPISIGGTVGTVYGFRSTLANITATTKWDFYGDDSSFFGTSVKSPILDSGGAVDLLLKTNNGTTIVTLTNGGGMQVGSPTGGDKGAGTINAVAVYDDNTLLTDYVFEHAYEGMSVRPFEPPEGWTLRTLDQLEAYTRLWYHLPGSVHAGADKRSVGQTQNFLTEKLEESYLHLFDHERRIKTLEAENHELHRLIGELSAQ